MARSYSPLHQRVILSLCFFGGGIGIGTWGANLPVLGRRASLDEGALGLVLLSFAAGAIVAMTTIPRIMAKLGAERVSVIAVGIFGLGIACLGLVAHIATALLVAGLAGLAFGALDVAMNSRAAHLERQASRPIMSSLHAMFSGGTLMAALIYAALTHRGIGNDTLLGLSGMSLLMLAAAAFAAATGAQLDPAQDAARKTPLRSAGISPAALTLGALAFVIFLAEGAIMDWSAVYLVRVLGTSDSLGATGYAIFSAMMLAGRLLGDRATRVVGAVRLFRICVTAVAVAMAAFLMAGNATLAFIALACCGFAMANVIPILFSAAGALGRDDGDLSMSRVITMGYAGILLGPALIGFVAEASTLSISLSMVLVGLAGVALCSKAVNTGAPDRTEHDPAL